MGDRVIGGSTRHDAGQPRQSGVPAMPLTRPPHPPIPPSPQHPRRRRGKTIRNVVLFVGLAFFTIWTLFPFLWIISTSIKPDRDLYRRVTLLPQTITDAHYIEVLFETPFLTYFRNSAMVAILTT